MGVADLSWDDPPSPEQVDAALHLTTDDDPRVRDAACFALAQWPSADSEAVRQALADRLDDADHEVRCEALVGLAFRGDRRALSSVTAALSRPSGEVWALEIIAAGALSDPSPHELLLRHQTGWDDEDAANAAAALRLCDPRGVGEDLFDGVAQLSRRRAHGQPEGDALDAWQLMSRMLDIAPQRAAEFHVQVMARLQDDPAALADAQTNSALAQDAAQGVTRWAWRRPE